MLPLHCHCEISCARYNQETRRQINWTGQVWVGEALNLGKSGWDSYQYSEPKCEDLTAVTLFSSDLCSKHAWFYNGNIENVRLFLDYTNIILLKYFLPCTSFCHIWNLKFDFHIQFTWFFSPFQTSVLWPFVFRAKVLWAFTTYNPPQTNNLEAMERV